MINFVKIFFVGCMLVKGTSVTIVKICIDTFYYFIISHILSKGKI